MNEKSCRFTELWIASLVIPEQVIDGDSPMSFVIPAPRRLH